MMAYKQIAVSASGKSQPIILDRYVNGYAVAVTMPTAGAVYTLQYTLSNPFDKYSNSFATSAIWFNCDDATLVNASTSRTTNFAFPPTAVRINVTAGVSAGRPVYLIVNPMGMDAA